MAKVSSSYSARGGATQEQSPLPQPPQQQQQQEDHWRRYWSEDDEQNRVSDTLESDTDVSSASSSAASTARRRRMRRGKILRFGKNKKEAAAGSLPPNAVMCPKFPELLLSHHRSESTSCSNQESLLTPTASTTTTTETISAPTALILTPPPPLRSSTNATVTTTTPVSLPPRPDYAYVHPNNSNGIDFSNGCMPHRKKGSKKLFPFRNKRKKQPSSSSLRGAQSQSETEVETDNNSALGPVGPSNSLLAAAAVGADSPNRTAISQRREATSLSEESVFRCGSEDDPVVRLFEQRNTQRVRFALEYGNEETPPPKPPQRQQEEQKQQPAQESQQQPQAVNSRRDDSNKNGSSGRTSPSTSPNRKLSRFLRGALFGGNNKSEKAAVDAEVERELESMKREMVWESTATTATGGEVVCTTPGDLTATFTEDPQVRAQVIKLLNKARRAQYVHFRYEYAVKCYVKALDILQQAKYPNEHPVAVKTLEALNHAHHVLSSYNNSSNIVKMGIKHEDTGELVRALKMYTIAYRIRVELLGRQHPSLVVLLNMLGNIQIKRGELREAMQIYELALKDVRSGGSNNNTSKNTTNCDTPHLFPTGDEDRAQEPLVAPDPPRNLLARGVTYRDMGIVYEKWGEHDQALDMYHRSLDCLARYKKGSVSAPHLSNTTSMTPPRHNNKSKNRSPIFSVARARLPQPPVRSVDVPQHPNDSVSNSSTVGIDTVVPDFVLPIENNKATTTATANATGGDDGMEVMVGRESEQEDNKRRVIFQASSDYDWFFPPQLDEKIREQQKNKNKDGRSSAGLTSTTRNSEQQQHQQQQRGNLSDLDAAMTLHQIGQLHRSVGEYNLALAAFSVSLRGMKYCVGRNHPNVAAILGNIGNLQKEMGDMDSSFATYQQVLGIESCRLGLSHPDVAVTFHNIATIDAARGNHEQALALYRQVIALQRKLFGVNHVAVAVTSACMGDVYERVGDIAESIGCFEEAVRIKVIAMGRHSLEVARLIHKLGKLSISQGEYYLADKYVSRATLIYRLNRLSEQDEWMVEAARDVADIDAAIAMGCVDGTATSTRTPRANSSVSVEEGLI